jgi:hypothetical protein
MKKIGTTPLSPMMITYVKDNICLISKRICSLNLITIVTKVYIQMRNLLLIGNLMTGKFMTIVSEKLLI